MSHHLLFAPHVVSGALCCALTGVAVAAAPAEGKRAFNLPRGDATTTLQQFAAAAGRPVLFMMEKVRGEQTNAVAGEFAPGDALTRMLAGTALVAREDKSSGAFVISRPSRDAPLDGPPAPLPQPETVGKALTKPHRTPLALIKAWLGLSLVAAGSHAADGTSSGNNGTIEGRVFLVATGSYLNNARISVTPPGAVVFTNEFGEFRLDNVPAGPVSVTVTYTGFPGTREAVTVTAGQSVRLDVKLSPAAADRRGDAVLLEAFVVGAPREMEARAIALNEQRFAPNLKQVVSTDEFGDLGNSTVGDFIKFLPGVIVDGEQVSVRGLPSHTVPLTVDGNRVATQFAEESRLRSSALDSVALNNVARVEVSKSPTPDSPADALGGAVNLVSKRAFERAKPLLRYHGYLTGTTEHLDFGKVPGPNPRVSDRRIRPGFDFSYVAPVNDRFGFTLTGVAFDQIELSTQLRQDWVPHGLGRPGATATNPYMARFEVTNRHTYRSRASFGTTVDWKLTPHGTLTLGAQYTYTTLEQVGNSNIGDVAGQNANLVPLAYGRDFTQGATNAGTQQYAGASRRVPITTYLLSANYRHDGPAWQLEGGGFFSKSTGRFRDIDYGFFQNSTFRMERATIRYDAIERDRPGAILVRNAAGQSVAPFTLGEYRILTATSAPKNELDFVYGAKAHARRHLGLAVPVTLKTGIDWREQIRDMRSAAPRWDFVGPDRVAGTADDLAGRYDLVEPNFTDGADVRGAEKAQWPSRFKLYQLFREHPEYFQFNEVGTLQTSTANSRKIVETVSAAYVRLDSRLLANRLLLVVGVRFEHTRSYGEGQLNDIRATYQQDAGGRLILDSAGRPIRVSADPAVRARLQFRERGAKAERTYDGFFPSFNATFNLRENLLARAAYARTFGRPNFQEIVPSIIVADPTAADPIITVTDPGLRPWTGDNYDLSLEYYFAKGGLVSAGVFRKNIRDFFGNTRTPATSERLAEFGLTDEFLRYDIASTTNVGDARVDGIEFDYRQPLSFLPRWARGLQVHGNATLLDLDGSSTADFDSFVRRSYNWGISLNRSRFTLSLNWHKRGRQQGGLFTNNNAPADTFQYTAPSQRLDLNASFRVTPRISIYGVVRNVTGSDASQRAGEIYSSQTPDYARLRIRRESPTAVNLGVKGEF